MPRRNQNLTREEAAVLRRLAERHGLTAASGPYAGQGSAVALQLALIAGDVAVVSLDPDDRQAVARWLEAQAPAAPAHLIELLQELAAELVYGLDAAGGAVGSSAEEHGGEINTLEG